MSVLEEMTYTMKIKQDRKWIVTILILSITLSMFFSILSESALSGAGYAVAFSVLAVIIVLGIIFDVIGVAATSAREAPFHSIASHGVKGAGEAIKLIRNAEKVSSVCNDVVGDICGILSGATSAIIVANLARDFGVKSMGLQVLISGLVAGLTIVGKAVGKTIAMENNTKIILAAGRVINFFGGIFRGKRG